MEYSKLYQRVNVTGWENDPSPKTPLDADNLNTMDKGIDDLDNRILELNEAKSDRNEVASMFTDVSLDSSTGIITFTKYDGSKKQIDTMLEKVVTNFDFDEQTQKLTLTLEDGTIKEVDLSSFISEYEFEDSDTIVWEVVDHKVVASIRNHSIGADQLETDYLANCEIAENNASNSASRAIDEALKSEGYSMGTQNGIPVDVDSPFYHNNAKYYSDRTGTKTIASLDDVALSNVEEGQALVYDAENDKWVNGDAIPKYKLNAPTNVSATAQNESVVLKWTDPDDLILGENTLAKWIGTAIIQKVGSAPTSIEDGTPVYASMVRNQHSEVGYVVEGLENDTEYFFGVFPVTEERVANTSVVVSATPEGNINPIKEWCQTIGLSYESLEDIPEADMRKLMSKHTSVDYFMEWYTADNSMLDEFTQNEFAMKWIGQNDYICDKLLAIEDAESRLLASEFWAYILKDHVPIMTSNSAPYGEVKASSVYSTSYDGYMAFDDSDDTQWSASVTSNAYIGYKFTNPICVKRITILYRANRINNYRIEASNDGFVNDIRVVKNGTLTETSGTVSVSIDVDDNSYNMEYHLFIVDGHEAGGYLGRIGKLQFYGRSLNVSVPTMTSNTQPYGEVICDTFQSTHEAYKAFDANTSTFWASANNPTEAYVGYSFDHPILAKMYSVQARSINGSTFLDSYKIQASNDKEKWDTLVDTALPSGSAKVVGSLNPQNIYKHYRIFSANGSSVGEKSMQIVELQFFGVDYSDRTERTYLYDHGVELVPWGCDSTVKVIDNSKYSSAVPFVKNANDMVSATLTDTVYNSTAIVTDNAIDLTPYSMIKGILKYKGYDGTPMSIDISNVNEMGYVSTNAFYYDDGNDLLNLCISKLRTNLCGSASRLASKQILYAHDKSSLMYVEEVWLE